MQMLKVSPDSSTPSAVPLISSNDTPAHRERLAVLVSTGKSKEAIGVQLTHDHVTRLSDKDVEKYCKKYEAYAGNKTTESLIDSFLMLVSQGVGQVVSIDDVKKLQKELKNDYIINNELSSFAGKLALRCGSLLAVANAALITTKHIDFNACKEPAFRRFALRADKEPGKEPDKEPIKEPGEEPGEEPGKEPSEEPGKEPV